MSETTQYVILKETTKAAPAMRDAPAWIEVGRAEAEPRTRRRAVLEQFLGPNPRTEAAGSYVVVRASEWKAEPVKIRQVSTVAFDEEFDDEPDADGEDGGA